MNITPVQNDGMPPQMHDVSAESRWHKEAALLRIGYQGDIGSNAEEAAKRFGDQLSHDAVEYVPLVTSAGVMSALCAGNVALGVVATRNSIGGDVEETRRMFDKARQKGFSVRILDELFLPIHHCLFSKADDSEIHHIASHEQALRQTTKWVSFNYPEADTVTTIDTAYAAVMLEAGELSDDTAVICRKNAGLAHGLALQAENIEDRLSETTFVLFEVSPSQ